MLPASLLDELPLGVLVTDAGLRLLQINRWLARRLPGEAGGRLGRHLAAAFPELAERGLLAAYELVCLSRQTLTLSSDLHRHFLHLPAPARTGLSELAQATTIVPLLAGGALTGTLTLIEDVSQQWLAQRQLQREIDKLTALHELDRALATLDYEACLKALVERTRSLFGGVKAAIVLCEPEGLLVAADAGFPRSSVGQRLPPEAGLAGWAVRHGQPVLCEDVAADPRYVAADDETRSEMAAPLLLRGECLGVINVESPALRAFAEADVEMLELLATRAAAAIHNARLHAAEREQHRLADTLRDIGLALAEELDPEAVLDTLLDHVARVAPYDSASVIVLDAGIEHVRIARCRGYERFGVDGLAAQYEAPLENLPILARMAATLRPEVVGDVRAHPLWSAGPTSGHIASWAGAPIQARGRLLGFLSLDKVEPGFYTLAMAEHLAAFAAQAGLALENARLYAAQQRLAVTDSLTGIANRRRFDQELARELQRSLRFRHSTALIMLDIDDFKQYNDTFGHLAGDRLLRTLALLLAQSIRAVDTVARYGGEEFALILPETNLAMAGQVAERLRELVRRLPLAPTPSGTGELARPITISLGVAVAPYHASAPAGLVEAADRALYEAKALGKDRVASLAPAPPSH